MYGYLDKFSYFLLGSAFIFISNITFTESANAEPILAANAPSGCDIFSKESDGILEVNGANTILSSKTEDGGSPGIVIIDCLGSINVSVSAPIRNGGSGVTTFDGGILSSTATSTELGLNTKNDDPGPQTLNNNPKGQIKVDMIANNGNQVISPGEYRFTVTLTVAPQ